MVEDDDDDDLDDLDSEEDLAAVCRQMLDIEVTARDLLEAELPGRPPVEFDPEEVASLLHYAYWAIRKGTTVPRSAPYNVELLWDRLEELVQPLVDFEMAAKGERYESLLRRGIDEQSAAKMAWHRLVSGQTIDQVPDDMLVEIPLVGPIMAERIRRLIDPLSGKSSV